MPSAPTVGCEVQETAPDTSAATTGRTFDVSLYQVSVRFPLNYLDVNVFFDIAEGAAAF
jgi:hypothetical protein